MIPLDAFTRVAVHRGHRVRVALNDAGTIATIECVACQEELVTFTQEQFDTMKEEPT